MPPSPPPCRQRSPQTPPSAPSPSSLPFRPASPPSADPSPARPRASSPLTTPHKSPGSKRSSTISPFKRPLPLLRLPSAEPVQQTAPVAAPPIAVNTTRERIPTRPVKPSAAPERQKLTRDQSPPAPIIERTPPPATPTTTPAVTSAAPPPPPQPTYRELSVPSGTSIPIRITQTLDSASAQEGQAFSGSVTSDVLVDGLVAIPQGSAVAGRVDAVQEAAHFKGNSLLTISLTSISRRGERIPITTDPYSKQGAGRGKNTATKTGVGAAAGAILGGIFGGG